MGTKPLKNLEEIVVVGGGMAGLAAARHAARLGRLVTLFEGSGLYGGQIATIGHVEGLLLPGDHSGQDLAMHLHEQAKKMGVRIVEAEVATLDAGPRLTLIDSEGGHYSPEAVIVASGAHLRSLGIPGEAGFAGRGVSRCATCDGGFYKDKHVVVIGGGDAAVHEALTLAGMVGHVTMVCRSPVKAKREQVNRLDARENVRFIWDSEVVEIIGDSKVTGVRLRSTRSGLEREILCDGVFPFIGVEPNAGFVPAKLRDESGHVPTGADLATPDPRIFAVGAVRAGFGGNLAEAMAEGVSAAEAAARRFAGRY